MTVEFVAVGGNGLDVTEENALSVAAKVSYGPLDLLVGGDLTAEVEESIRYDVGQVEVYKVHHHGSRTSSSSAFLNVLKPAASFISVGVGNSFGHPTVDVTDRLRLVGSALWLTEDVALDRKLGDIWLTSADGREFTVTQGGASQTLSSFGTGTPDPGDGAEDTVPNYNVGCSQAGGLDVPLALIAFGLLPLWRRARRVA